MIRLFFSAGESSGDAHGAALIRALRAQAPNVACEGLGGAGMAAAGMRLRHDLAREAFMGFFEVARHLPKIRRIFLDTAAYLEQSRPDALVLIDYPGFNIRLAQRAHAAGIPVVYYVSPQVWAWKKKRIQTIAKCVRRMLVIFPFEQPLYQSAGVDCVYVGHPLLDHIAAHRPKQPAAGPPLTGLLPGSRAQEIARLLPVMIGVARGVRERRPEMRFAAAAVNEERARQVREIAAGFPLEVSVGGMYDLLAEARFCMVASGTATLETALFGVPLVILYRVSPPTYWLARLLVDVEHIGMVNILAGKSLVPEFIQHEASAEKILPQALELIDETPARARMIDALRDVRERLGAGGASERAASAILEVARASRP